jgi:hypothetical protein
MTKIKVIFFIFFSLLKLFFLNYVILSFILNKNDFDELIFKFTNIEIVCLITTQFSKYQAL